MKKPHLVVLVLVSLVFAISCKSNTIIEDEASIYPKYADQNSNGINDYVELESHLSGSFSTALAKNNNLFSKSTAGHNFTDNNGDGICDLAQDGSNSWHGPGFIDQNKNGVCDYWDESHTMHQRHRGMQYRDTDSNGINDFMQSDMHWAEHNFTDTNEDGICDKAQDGSPSWHGPGFVDQDGDGTCDFWQSGGQGHGGMGGGHH